MKSRDVIVVGAGPAGCAAAVQCSRLGLKVLLIEKEKEVGGLLREARLVENYPGLEKPLPGPVITSRLADFLKRFEIEPLTAEVSWIDESKDGFLICTGKKIHRSRGVILATGTEPVPFELPGDAPVRGSLLKVLKDKPSRAAVIGGGEAALDYALNLSDRGCEVELIVRSGEFRADGTLPEAVKTRPNIGIHFNTTATGIEAAGEGALLHLTEMGRDYTISVNAVLAAVGREPAFPILREELNIRGNSTQLPGLLVAGDIAEGSLGQASTASGQGIRAAGLMVRYLREKGQK